MITLYFLVSPLTVGKRVDLEGLADVTVNASQAGQGVATFNVHGAGTADTFTA